MKKEKWPSGPGAVLTGMVWFFRALFGGMKFDKDLVLPSRYRGNRSRKRGPGKRKGG